MKILFITHSFNSLSQRLYCELTGRGHQVSIEFDISDSVTEEAVALFQPELIIAPFLKRAIPESIWSRHRCLIVHPGVPGDRGPSALDWAIQRGVDEWGVTVLQAEAEMDAGPVWASANFPMAATRKASLYRNQVTEAAVRAVLKAVERVAAGDFEPQRVPGKPHELMKQSDRHIDWQMDCSALVLAKLNAADGFPGVADSLFGQPCHLFDAWPEAALRGVPGTVLGWRETAICRATPDGAVWIGHVKRPGGIKLPATLAFPEATDLPELPLAGCWKAADPTWQDIAYEEAAGVGFLSFEFYNGAMSTAQCRRLTEAFRWATTRPTKVIVLRGGSDFWSNGIHLNTIEAADSPADESWANINAIDDLAEAIRAGQIARPALRHYGVDQADAVRWGLPCGGRLSIALEPAVPQAHLAEWRQRLAAGRLVRRTVRLGTPPLLDDAPAPGTAADFFAWTDGFSATYGPRQRLLVVGANQISAALVPMAARAQGISYEALCLQLLATATLDSAAATS